MNSSPDLTKRNSVIDNSIGASEAISLLTKRYDYSECPRVNAKTVEAVIKTFPPTWDFKLTMVTVVPKKDLVEFFVVGSHNFGYLTFRFATATVVKVERKTGQEPKMFLKELPTPA